MRYGRGSRRGKAKTKKKRRRGKNLKGGRVPRRTILVTVSEVILSAVFSIRTSGNKRNKSTRFKQSIRIKKNLKFSQTKPITVSVLVLAWFFHIRHFAQFGPVCIFVVVPACYLAAHFCRLVKCIRLHLKCGMWNDKAYKIFRYQCCTIILDMINERIHWLTQHALPVRHHRDSNVFFSDFVSSISCMPMETVMWPVHFNIICHGGDRGRKAILKEVQERKGRRNSEKRSRHK